LRNLTKGLNGVNEIPLNFKVYKEDEINAFACADGSVRVYTGIMDVMTDNELLGVIGHEIGHVAMSHTKRQMQSSILTSAALEGLASTSDKVATLTDSQLGALGEAIVNAQFSKRQESEADDFSYNFLVAAGKNPWALVMSFEKMQAMSASSGTSNAISNLFSSHPDTAKRIERISQRCVTDGFNRPTK
jgi:putative metalloprotease